MAYTNLGSVNAAKEHYIMAVDYLQQSQEYWPGLIEKVITNKFLYTDYQIALMAHEEQEIMSVIKWA